MTDPSFTFEQLAASAGIRTDGKSRPVVCVQGLGFVGAAMSVAVSEAADPQGNPRFNVVGIDLPGPRGERVIRSLNEGKFPAETDDANLVAATSRAYRRGNLVATADAEAFRLASVVIVDINLDLGPTSADGEPFVDFSGLRAAIRTFATRISPDCLVLVETTVPPGTCAHVVAPEIRACFAERGLDPDSFLLAHSYERVMPGNQYLSSITNFWRVFAGYNEAAARKCEEFLLTVVNAEDFPMSRMDTITASETAKVLENSYRATNIAFIEEWGRFAESVGVDLFQVLDAIRMRPTHNNIRQPGFGVGGYCLTKDPLFARFSATTIFKRPELDFPFSRRAVAVNNQMPLVSVGRLTGMFGGDLRGRKVLLLGVSYRPDVGDTRYSASEIFARALVEAGASVVYHDPLVHDWPEMNAVVLQKLPPASGFDAIVLAVAHREYRDFDFASWIGENRPKILDTNNVLSRAQIESLVARQHEVKSIGRGSPS
ncbi:MAG TPA: nucleotide sugar dehydrogenase [Leptospiraceae bacterium]|nr:nucleotide sugar dehydrogenase [Leptospirales bacterium]HMU82473.1 nucleotide sugar dehydrogenase [Leptospiraceae bacterium]HMW58201.1 nucleotide sugar dehydrogenase [Leptospiraceae bacterium]HMX56003.1 nucleotide sugar dehydrogenase [Leptospiraceae bacterium]HMY44574.1 nucleotide sugar dehydrogenase [Leptospiraceae bacterium]